MQWPGDASQPSTPTRGSSWWAMRRPMRMGTALGKTSRSWWRVPSEDHSPPYWRSAFLGGTGCPLGLADQSGGLTTLDYLTSGKPTGSWRHGSWPCGYLKITQSLGTGLSCKLGGTVALPGLGSLGKRVGPAHAPILSPRGLVIAMVMSLLFIVLLRFLAGIMVWVMIVMVILVLGYGKSSLSLRHPLPRVCKIPIQWPSRNLLSHQMSSIFYLAYL